MLIKTKAIVLHSLKLGDSQMIVEVFTEQMGRVSLVCHISQSAKSKIKKQFFQPLTVIALEFDYRQNVKLQHIRDVRIALPFTSIPFDPFKLSISLFIAEFLYHATRDEQSNPPLFAYIENSIEWLDGSQRSFSNFHLVFMMRLSRFLGFFPNLEDYREGDFFDLRNGVFITIPPLHPDYLRPDEAAKIRLLMRMNFETMHLFAMSRQERNRCAELIIIFYRLHIPNFPDLKSLAVLKELFT